MYTVNIYLITNFKSPRQTSGNIGYVLEAVTEKGSADCSDFKEIKDSRKNRAELEALKTAAGRLNQPCDIHIYTDSGYVAAAFYNRWTKYWQEHDWKNSKGESPANIDLWMEVLDLLNGSTVTVHKNEKHSYRAWMEMQLRIEAERSIHDNQQKNKQ